MSIPAQRSARTRPKTKAASLMVRVDPDAIRVPCVRRARVRPARVGIAAVLRI